jgi:hypothetical protein
MGSIGVAPGAARLHLVDWVSLLRPEHRVFAAITTQVWVTWGRYTLDDHIRIGDSCKRELTSPRGRGGPPEERPVRPERGRHAVVPG